MADSGFEKKFRLLSARDFSSLKVQSLTFKKPALIVFFKKNTLNLTRIGISVPKKIGISPMRNRYKRLIREAFRSSDAKLLGYDVLFVVSWSRALSSSSLETKEAQLLLNLSDFFLELKKRSGQS